MLRTAAGGFLQLSAQLLKPLAEFANPVMGNVGFFNQLLGSVVHQVVEIIRQRFGVFGNLRHLVVLRGNQSGRFVQRTVAFFGNRAETVQAAVVVFRHLVHVGGGVVGRLVEIVRTQNQRLIDLLYAGNGILSGLSHGAADLQQVIRQRGNFRRHGRRIFLQSAGVFLKLIA